MGGSDRGDDMHVLMVEDNRADARLAREALERRAVPARFHVVRDGEEALAFLRREGAFRGAPRPDLILLDLNLPRKDGRELLSEVKADPTLRLIPVVILTTSSAPQDVQRAYALHANCYIIKPVRLEEFMGVIDAIAAFWFRAVTLPTAELEGAGRGEERSQATRERPAGPPRVP